MKSAYVSGVPYGDILRAAHFSDRARCTADKVLERQPVGGCWPIVLFPHDLHPLLTCLVTCEGEKGGYLRILQIMGSKEKWLAF